jgi:imidazole glycerol-phosphate synthase subunit HisH
MDKRVCIVDYGSGNIRSVFNIFRNIHTNIKVSNCVEDINRATHIVLPGVGAFKTAMDKLEALPAFKALAHNVLNEKKKFLGICVGMQILADKGYEHGEHDGLGWIPGVVKKLNTQGLYLPHVGWNNFLTMKDTPLLSGITADMDFYYVHSYYFEPSDTKHSMATCDYGMEFTSVVNKDNIYGVQFHPEKSQKVGKRLLENFLA